MRLVTSALALMLAASSANAAVIAGKLTKFDSGLAAIISLSDENSKNCDKEFPGSKFAALEMAVSRTAQILYRYPGCYTVSSNGDISMWFWDTQNSQWSSSTMNESAFKKSARFTGWPKPPKDYKQEADQLFDAMMEYEKEKAR